MKASVHSAVRTVGDGSPSKAFLLWDEQLLTLVNFPPEVTKLLTFTTKKMVTENFRRKTKYVQEQVYELKEIQGIRVLKTHQGFWQKILKWALAQRLQVEFIDLRGKDLLPLPTLGLMGGFRFSQRELLVKALSFNCSGCILAATRYGKSTLLKNILKAWPDTQTVVALPGSDLLEQMVGELRVALPDREIKQLGGKSRVKFQSEDITVCSADSMHKLDPGPVRLMLLDEPHAFVAESRIVHLPRFHLARIYALGATLGFDPDEATGRYDGRDYLLEGIIGPILARKPYPEARAEGAVCLIVVLMIVWELPDAAGDRDDAYKQHAWLNERMGKFCRWLSDSVIPRSWQSLFFIKNEEQADYLHEWVGKDVSVAMAKKLTPKERTAMTERVRTNGIKRVICSDIYVQGVTFHEIMCLVNCGGGGASTTTIQKPGRLAEIRPGKTAGLLADFLYVPQRHGPVEIELTGQGVKQMVRESALRLEAYRKTGYAVHVVEQKDVAEWFRAQNIQPPTPHA